MSANFLTTKYSKLLLFIVCLCPFLGLLYALLTEQLGANPIENVTRQTGVWALRFLLLTLTLTPFGRLSGWRNIVRFRRMLGLFAFFYASLHMLLYLGLDQFFDWRAIWDDVVKRPFITVGFISFIGLLPLAMTSTNRMMKRLGGKRWKRLHQLSYFIVLLACCHYFMLVKADIRQPLIYAGLACMLLLMRFQHYYRQKRAGHRQKNR